MCIPEQRYLCLAQFNDALVLALLLNSIFCFQSEKKALTIILGRAVLCLAFYLNRALCWVQVGILVYEIIIRIYCSVVVVVTCKVVLAVGVGC